MGGFQQRMLEHCVSLGTLRPATLLGGAQRIQIAWVLRATSTNSLGTASKSRATSSC
jgi:hypothetical protein